jgi:hypothetical protein
VDSTEPTRISRRGSAGLWIFAGTVASVGVTLWILGLFPVIIYADTVGSLGNIVSKIPSIDIMTVVIIWAVAMVIGLMGRRARHRSQAGPARDN